jgi:hypothetical protein
MRQTFQPATRLSAFDLPVRFEVDVGLLPPEREHFANRRDHGVDRRLQCARKSSRLARPHPTTGVAGGQEDWSGGTQPAYPTDAIAAPHQVSQPDRRAYEVCTIVRWSQVVKLRGPWGGAVVIACTSPPGDLWRSESGQTGKGSLPAARTAHRMVRNSRGKPGYQP